MISPGSRGVYTFDCVTHIPGAARTSEDVACPAQAFVVCELLSNPIVPFVAVCGLPEMRCSPMSLLADERAPQQSMTGARSILGKLAEKLAAIPTA